MTPHRIGPLLCATFLVLAGAASADQTWTTAWTPDSAHAARTKMEPEKDHRSNTNCYPCKQWAPGTASGRGAMINDPSNSTPRKCPGINTDYTCKVCDGQGDLMDKPDSTECNTGDGKPGKCCDGICVEVPPEGMDPCEWDPKVSSSVFSGKPILASPRKTFPKPGRMPASTNASNSTNNTTKTIPLSNALLAAPESAPMRMPKRKGWKNAARFTTHSCA